MKAGIADDTEKNKGASAAYCSLFWLAGLAMSVGATATHLLILPYADLTLLSTNSITGIVFALVLSIIFLDEKL